jgi:hypothetical protein
MLVEDYQRQVNHRRLFYPWHGVHILFEAAVIMLDSCWSARDLAPLREQAHFILSITLLDCLALLAKVGERWHEAALCADHLRPVVDEVAVAFNERIMNDMDLDLESKESETTEKLRQLMFPDGPLAWNARTAEESPGRNDLEISGMGDHLGAMSEFQYTQWDGGWDLVDLLHGNMTESAFLSL